MNFFNDHKKLFSAALLLFVGLTLIVVIIPAIHNQNNNAVLRDYVPLSADAAQGRLIFIANGCVGCHTQQVRNVEMDKVFGSRPSIAADYAPFHRIDTWRNTATLMGTERTGPDLTNIGSRQPSVDWQLTHLFNPRLLVKESVMPAYSWLFRITKEVAKGEVVVKVPDGFLEKDEKVVAEKEALQLVMYLLSLKQVQLPDGAPTPEFLYKKIAKGNAVDNTVSLNGAELYTANCQGCHQANGEGLKGAFPPLKGSKVVLDDNPELMVTIIMKGYEGRIKEGFGPMPPVGTNNNLSPEEITAIMNHERSSWGNSAKKVSADDVKKIVDLVKANK